MSDTKNDIAEEVPEEKVIDKYNLGAADLEKVSIFDDFQSLLFSMYIVCSSENIHSF
jgi:hypothetical protein